jgi:orotidine-5'-phosphate decarboxylase
VRARAGAERWRTRDAGKDNPFSPDLVEASVSVRFSQRLDRVLKARNSLLCVGLDPDPASMPTPLKRLPPKLQLERFLDGIVAATSAHCAAYKMQLGAFLQYGPDGMAALARRARRIGPHRIRILDLKANDIPNTMRMVRAGVFDAFGFDAMTVTPWMGWESLEPLFEESAHGVFLVAHSSNPGSADFQEIPTPRGHLWLAVVEEARRLAHAHGNLGVVLGATFSEALRTARTTLGNGVPILVPGIGAQGGSLATTVREGVDAHGRALLVNASRSILYASSGKDWKLAAGREAARLNEQINQLRPGPRTALATAA